VRSGKHHGLRPASHAARFTQSASVFSCAGVRKGFVRVRRERSRCMRVRGSIAL
jgi:hypothetical protein